jgi:hypothetical protein
MRKRVYISGPLSVGHSDFGRNWNLFQANLAQSELMRAGYSTYNPMLSMAQQDQLDWDTWLESDEAWVAVSDLVLLLPGGSRGAVRECDFARSRNIPVVGPAYFFDRCPGLKELFPDETEMTYCRDDDRNLMRFRRAERRAAGLPTMDESDPRLIPYIVEGFKEVQ